MKKCICLILILSTLVSCTQTKPPLPASPDSIAIIVNGDTIGVDKRTNDAFILVHSKYDSIKHVNDSLTTALFRANYKLVRTQYYVNICMKHPVNDKYLKGWIRALFE